MFQASSWIIDARLKKKNALLNALILFLLFVFRYENGNSAISHRTEFSKQIIKFLHSLKIIYFFAFILVN